ncbi:hypothetical protein KN815_03600 [Streptomyces sp. 4503]|uniref:Secreted protein n=1 Tax=Streptomyces niphimycinicus TaxID=2842201 RepID=A0ABS6C8J7_9ACTN|nr:hypothetical protein [Streptomyces niphimycinicus]MBU3863214.1 hypothetical protein [Streptomyces niphimycinicus]
MLGTIKAAGIAAAAALALTGFAATPASASALKTDGYLDCYSYSVDAWGSGYMPGQTIVVRHLGDYPVAEDTLVVKADGTWRVDERPFGGWDYTVEVRDTQGNVLDSKWIHQCGIW